jgi:serine/threonine protein kinase
MAVVTRRGRATNGRATTHDTTTGPKEYHECGNHHPNADHPKDVLTGGTEKSKKNPRMLGRLQDRFFGGVRFVGRKYGGEMTILPIVFIVTAMGLSISLYSAVLRNTDGMVSGMDSPILQRRRSHTFSYWDEATKAQISRTIQIDAPRRLSQTSFPASLNYNDRRGSPSHPREAWFDFNLPDDGMAFDIPNANQNKQCFPMGEWQVVNRQTCNTFHEQTTVQRHDTIMMRFINCGENRCTFLLDNQGSGESYVLKSLKLGKLTKQNPSDFAGPGRYQMAIKDSLALDKLSSSPYVVNLYGSCGVSQIVEHSSGGNIHDLLKRSRQARNFSSSTAVEQPEAAIIKSKQGIHKPPQQTRFHVHEEEPSEALSKQQTSTTDERFHLLSPLAKLKIAFHVATAVADMHAIEEHPLGFPSMAHNDLCCHQFMLVDGIYKLGDFDWATFLTQTAPSSSSLAASRLRRTTNVPPPELCQTTPLQMSSDYLKGLAPEELVYYEDLEEALIEEGFKDESYKVKRVYRDKLDVFQVGNIMYTLLTNKWIWEGHTTYAAMVAVVHVRNRNKSRFTLVVSVFDLD